MCIEPGVGFGGNGVFGPWPNEGILLLKALNNTKSVSWLLAVGGEGVIMRPRGPCA